MDNEENSIKPNTEENKTPPQKTPKKKHGVIFEIVQFIFIAAIIVIPFRMFIAQPFIVNGRSMDPTFKDGEYLIVDQLSYHLNKPQRDSVLIFKYPNDTSKYFIKRIIGMPGETVNITKGVVTIKKNPQDENGIVLTEPYVTHQKNDTEEWVLKDTEYFVMGDNRLESLDSRSWGPLDKKYIIGRPFVRLLPINKIEFLPGNYDQKL